MQNEGLVQITGDRDGQRIKPPATAIEVELLVDVLAKGVAMEMRNKI